MGLFGKIMNFQAKVLSPRRQQCEAVAPKRNWPPPAGWLHSLPITLCKLPRTHLNSIDPGKSSWLRVSKTVLCPKRDQPRDIVINTTLLEMNVLMGTDWAVLIHNSICSRLGISYKGQRGKEHTERLQMPRTVTVLLNHPQA